ncbi:MAG: aldo/keto reductase [Atopobiaceae bacterium]|nr:aldo/keto reductase [Atopobiaceae bacterium]
MRYIPFGVNEAQVSEVVLGTMRIPQMSAAEVGELLETCLDEGINMVDTADIYGGGHCEELLGEAFVANPGLRDQVFLQTKCSIRFTEGGSYFDFSKDYIIEAVDASLKRLKTDHVESLLLHRPDVLMEPDEIAEAFDELHNAGKVLEFGVSNQNPMQMRRIARASKYPLAANQIQLSVAFAPAFEAMLNVNMENDPAVMRDGGIFEYCERKNMAIQAWSVFQHGYFAGTFLGAPEYEELNVKLDELAEKYGVTPGAVALAWILRYPAKMQAVIGTTKASRIRESARACDFTLERPEWYDLYKAVGRQLP